MTAASTPKPPPLVGDPRETTRLVGLTVFLGSWAIAFTSLVFAYLFLRTQSSLPWPPPDAPALPVARAALNTAAAVVGSVFAHRAVLAARRNERGACARWLAGAAVAGLVFLGLQASAWRDLWAAGLVLPSASRYPAVFYTLTGFHALHVAAGAAGLAGLAWRVGRGGAPGAVHGWALFWHFVGAVWLALFGVLFLL